MKAPAFDDPMVWLTMVQEAGCNDRQLAEHLVDLIEDLGTDSAVPTVLALLTAVRMDQVGKTE